MDDGITAAGYNTMVYVGKDIVSLCSEGVWRR